MRVIFGKLKIDNDGIQSQLKNLTLEGLSELKHVWGENCQGNPRFQNLLHVSVSDCKGLKMLFPVAVAKNIKKLETLQIESCQNLTEIVGKEVHVAADRAEKFVFPCLTSLHIYDLPELTYFYCEIFNVECPELRKLLVLDCSKFELFQSARLEGEGSSTSINRQPLFSNLQAISFLEELAVDWKHSSVLRTSLQIKEDLNFLKEIRMFFDVDDNEKPTLPFGILDKAPNIQDLSIEWCKSLEIFQTPNFKISEQLKTLTLFRVSEPCSEDSSWLNLVSEKLYSLNVISCPGLTKLFLSPALSDFSLKKLYIKECHGLEYLFTSSVTKVLKHLEEIEVKDSRSIKGIVEMEQDGTTSQGLEFERLYSIALDSLSSLEYFYSGYDTLQLPSLVQVNIQQCPKMEVFSRGEINAKSFRGVHNSVEQNDELIFHNDLNGSVKMVGLLQMLSEGTDGIEFVKHPELHKAWQDGLSTKNNWFYSLKTLKLVNCVIEGYAIPSNLFPCLKSLKELEVRNCNKVKVIFAKIATETILSQLNTLTLEDLSDLILVWEKNFQGILRFQNLKQVSVIGCRSIQTLFPAILAENLKMLEKLEVNSCNELQEIVGKEDVPTGSEKRFPFPHLTSLDLYELPEFRYFYPEIFTVECPKLNDLSVLDCPKFELFEVAHPEGEAESVSMRINRQPLIPDLNAISIIKELYLDWKHISVLRLGQLEKDLKYLKEANLYFDMDKSENTSLLFGILEKAPNLQTLRLGFIKSLEIFLIQNPEIFEHGILLQLEILTLNAVSEIHYINFDNPWLNLVCEKLHELNVINCRGLNKLFRSPSTVSFSCMKELYIRGCHGLRYLFRSSVANVLTSLEKITVTESQSIIEIVAKEQDGTTDQGVKFEKVCYIDLNSLSSLECFYSGNGSLELPSLTQVDIWRCSKLEVFSRGEIQAESFRGIQASSDSNDQLVIHNDLNASVKRVFLLQMLSEGIDGKNFSEHPELQELQEAWHDGHTLQNNWFYTLTTLKLVKCDIRPYAIPSYILSCLKSLEELEVRNCNKVKVVFAYNGTEDIPTQLKILTLEDLSELTRVWEKNFQGILKFQNLQQVSVIGCKSIQTLFPDVLAENLKMLEKLEVKSCDGLREIVGKEDVATGSEKKFLFPHLSSLELFNLPDLTYFCPEIFTVECPKLNDFLVLDCPKLELFEGAHAAGDTESVRSSINRQPLLSDLTAFSILEELSLDWKHISVLRLGQHAEDFKYLKKISLFFDGDDNEKPTLPLEVLEKAPNIQEIVLGLINSLEIFLTQNSKFSEHRILGQLKILTMNDISELQYINLEDSWLDAVCEKLHELNVINCHGLKKLLHSPTAVSFSCMKELYISGCDELMYLFTSSMAKVLTFIEKITVTESQSIKEIVAKEQDGTTAWVKFERLSYIDLNSLSTLECFYSGNEGLQLPSLTQVDIWQCPKVKVFSRGEIIAESFRGIQASSDSNDQLVFHNDLNASVKRVFLLQMLSEGMDVKNFSEHPELQEAWHDGHTLEYNLFFNLTTLKLVNCDIQPYAIPSYILPCLKILKELEVRNCNTVKVIFAYNDTEDIPTQLKILTLQDLSELTLVWEKNFQGILKFQNLQQVTVIGCESIQTVFPDVLAENLKMLEKLKVKSCDGLREIVGKEDVATHPEKKFLFPHLISLYLFNLPDLTYFYPEIFTVDCPKLNEFTVVHCPKLELFQAAHPECDTESIGTSVIRQPLIRDLNAISMVKELSLNSKHISMLKLGQHVKDFKYLNKANLYFDEDKNEKPSVLFGIFETAPNLQDLWLGFIKNLEIFLLQNPEIIDNGILVQLKILTLTTVSELQYINFENSWLNLVCDKLQELNVFTCPGLKKLFHSPSAVSFSCMKELYISGCNELMYLFTSSMAKVLTSLEKITVLESQSIKEIVAKEQDGTTEWVKFERLSFIDLNSLSTLECFYSGNEGLQLPSLTHVEIWRCPKVKVFSRGEIFAESFRGIQASSDSNDQLVFHNDLNASVKRVFLLQMLSEGMDGTNFSEHPELQEAWHDGLTLENNWFYTLTTLKLVKCDLRQYAIPSYILSCLKSLEELEVRNCDKVKVVFAYNDTKDIPTQLKILTLQDLSELTFVWEKNFEGILKFQNLQQVTVVGCESLQTLFPDVLAENLKMLEKLKVESCDGLREIVAKEEVATGLEKKFLFPHLISLYLSKLPDLTYFYPEIFTVECPKLHEFSVVHCPKLELFQDAHPECGTESIGTSIIRLPLIRDLNAISMVKELSLNSKHISMLKLGQHVKDFKYLNKANLYFDWDKNEKSSVLFGILEKAPNLQDLWLGFIKSLEIFLVQNPEIIDHGILAELKILTLNTISDLQYINLENSWLNAVCEKLHDLNVINCHSLETIFHSPCATSFTCLKELNVSWCHGLKYLFTSSMTKVLMSLEKIIVKESHSITQIIAKEQDETTLQVIKFERLYCIDLNSLSNLECFYSGYDTFLFPSLTQVDIWKCPKLKVFSRGEISAESFRGIQASSGSNDQLVFHNDLNASVKRVFLLQMLSEGIDGKNFSEYPELQEAWHDGHTLENNWFYTLTTLKLVKCDIRPYAIPSYILSCLKSLEELEVRNCNKVKVVFADNDTEDIPTQLKILTLQDLSELTFVWEKNFQGILKFQNLQQVTVVGCESLQTLFPDVLAENLKMLEKLKVKSCDGLREIVGKEDVATGLEKKFLFPHLISLYLFKLPDLTYFYPDIFSVECPKLHEFSVVHCPKLELFQDAHPECGTESIGTSIIRQPLIRDLNAISMVKELSLNSKHISVLKLGQHVKDFKYLNKANLYFDVDKNEKPSVLFGILEKAPNLQDLWLGFIKSLEIFLVQNPEIIDHGIRVQLKILTLNTVSDLQYINLENSWLSAVCEKLHDLNVINCPSLKTIFHSPCVTSFTCLKELNISWCHGLKYLFTSSMTKVLMSLEKIIVKESHSITQIIAKEHDETTLQVIKFERLYCIDLNSLSNLECFYSGYDTFLFPSITQVDIWKCPKLKVFSRGEISAESFRGIQASSDSNEQLVFHNDLNASVKRVFLLQMLSEGMDGKNFSEHPELQEAWNDGHTFENNWFYTLTTLKLVKCDIRPYAIPSYILSCLKSLEELEVRNCNKVKVVFADNDTEDIPTQLKILTLEDLSELTRVWEKNFQGILKFQNLQQVSVIGCKSIQTLFPDVLAENLKMLEKLEVKSCVGLREIVGKEDVATGSEKKFLFPQLSSLELFSLAELTFFYPEIFTVECPKLNIFSVMHCLKFELFQGAHPESDAESLGTSVIRQPLIRDLNAISMVEVLSLSSKHISVLRLGQHVKDFKYLNKTNLYFDVDKNEKPSLLFGILEKAPNLQDLWLAGINSNEIFLIQNPKIIEHGYLVQLKILTLNLVSELQYINLENSWLNTVCEKLRELNVINCRGLNKLFRSPSAVSFSCMKKLNISRCHGLRYLFRSSVANMLTFLEKITVTESQSIIYIVAQELNETTDQGVKFERLCYIDLNSLSSLECFYSGNGSLQLPSLTQVVIRKCPKLKIFSQGEINAESFRGIQASSDSNDQLILYNNDLNDSVQKLFLLRQDHLVFEDTPLLKLIWLKSETVPDWCFCNLISLVVKGCEFLTDVVLPSHLLPFLSKLKTLEVRNCNSVMAIFVNTKIGPQGSLGLPFLEKLCVENCKNLLEIVATEETASKESNEVITVFPRITILRLWNLPNLRCIYPGLCILEWPMLKGLYVTHCAKLKFFETEFQSSRDSFPTTQQDFVSLEKVTPSLNVLTLSKEEAKMIDQGKLHVDLQELNTIRLLCFHDKTDVYPFVFHSKAALPSTKYLVVRHSAFKEIFPSQTPDIDCTKVLSQLKGLELHTLPQLESIGFERSWIGPFIENLQIINVWYCSHLTNLTPSTVSFSQLKRLDVQDCNRLKYLFTSSTAKTLSVLKEMKLVNCESIIEIVSKEGDEPNEGEMLFMELNIVTLGSLPKLENFYSGSFALNFSSLKEVSFTQCNNTKVFRVGDKVPDELKVTIDGVVWEGDTNEVIMQKIDEAASDQ